MGIKTVAMIQARMGSTRLPGKVMLNLCGKPVLVHVVERVQQAKQLDNVVVLTSTKQADDVIYNDLNTRGIHCFRGEEQDVLSRYYHAANQYSADAIVRITADCPLIDPRVIDAVVACFRTNPCDYASNIGEPRTFPRGLDCEVFTFSLLEQAYYEATEPYEREHVTPFMYWKQNRIANFTNTEDASDQRWTLDTPEDFAMIEAVYRHFYQGKHDFYWKEIRDYLNNHPELYKLNHYIQQKKIQKV